LDNDDRKSQVRSLLYEQLRVAQQQHAESELVSVDAHDSSIQAASDDDFCLFWC
jgi:hypothetical protein